MFEGLRETGGFARRMFSDDEHRARRGAASRARRASRLVDRRILWRARTGGRSEAARSGSRRARASPRVSPSARDGVHHPLAPWEETDDALTVRARSRVPRSSFDGLAASRYLKVNAPPYSSRATSRADRGRRVRRHHRRPGRGVSMPRDAGRSLGPAAVPPATRAAIADRRRASVEAATTRRARRARRRGAGEGKKAYQIAVGDRAAPAEDDRGEAGRWRRSASASGDGRRRRIAALGRPRLPRAAFSPRTRTPLRQRRRREEAP